MEKIFLELKAMMGEVMPEINLDGAGMDSELRTDLGIESFKMILLAVSIEEHFGIQLDESFTPKKISDVCQYILDNSGKN